VGFGRRRHINLAWKMTCTLKTVVAVSLAMLSAAHAQTIRPDAAMSEPDRVSWALFVQLVAPAGRNVVVFETWASNEDTFKAAPEFPSATPSPKILRFPALGGQISKQSGPWQRVAPGGEEVRRNKATFDYITDPKNRFHTRQGLAEAFAANREISLPAASIEVKANWIAADAVERSRYYVNVASDGQEYALVSLHITTKLIPNWTWATFEHEDNRGRCDDIGCRDSFGATTRLLLPNATENQGYPACRKKPELLQIITSAKLAEVFSNYCLKGTQVEFTTATGVPTLLGSSVTESGFTNTASCITCHARASVNAAGGSAQGYGFMTPPDRNALVCPTDGRCSPNGTPNPAWFSANPGSPDRQLKALQTDFLFSLPLHAIGP
jgi:hypothetical protein